jgi:hypothetical protein
MNETRRAPASVVQRAASFRRTLFEAEAAGGGGGRRRRAAAAGCGGTKGGRYDTVVMYGFNCVCFGRV